MSITPQFDPLAGLGGGFLIGLAAVLLLAILGRVAGISGMVSGVLSGPAPERAWRALFLTGLLTGALLYHRFTGSFPFEMRAEWPLILLGGLLVGWGTRVGSGCTSGHGVCGIARGRTRSLVATTIFMLTAMLTVAVQRVWTGG